MNNINIFKINRESYLDPENFRKIKIFSFKIKEDKFILIISTIVGTIFLISILLLKLYENYIIFAIVIIVNYIIYVFPYNIYKILEEMEIKNIEEEYPLFLRSLAEGLSSGMTLLQAMRNALKQDFGPLNKYVEKLYIWLSWGLSFEKAFEKFNSFFYNSRNIRRVNYVILEAYKSGGDISKTIRTISEDLDELKELNQLKKAYISQQTLVMYVVYFVFIGLLISIIQVLQPFISQQALFNANHISSGIGISFNGGIPISWVKTISFISIIMEAFSISIIIGYSEENNIRGSLKHLTITTFIGVLIYILVIYPSTISVTLLVNPTQPYVYQSIQISILALENGQPINGMQGNLFVYCNGERIYFIPVTIQNGQFTQSIQINQAGNCQIEFTSVYGGKRINKVQNIQVIE